jgi:GAF domain-containing protein
MLAGDELKGAFTLYRRAVRPFEEADIRLVEQFADQAVIALENARLIQETRELSNSLSRLNLELEAKVVAQVSQLQRLSRLTQFLPAPIAELAGC